MGGAERLEVRASEEVIYRQQFEMAVGTNGWRAEAEKEIGVGETGVAYSKAGEDDFLTTRCSEGRLPGEGFIFDLAKFV